jgi:hypothetical protein
MLQPIRAPGDTASLAQIFDISLTPPAEGSEGVEEMENVLGMLNALKNKVKKYTIEWSVLLDRQPIYNIMVKSAEFHLATLQNDAYRRIEEITDKQRKSYKFLTIKAKVKINN